MKITYLGHATLLVETGGLKILTDPWLFGPAYCEQWFQFPRAKQDVTALLQEVDVVCITHGHEDHLHYETLKRVNKRAAVYFPYTWYYGAIPFFKDLGFENIIEAKNGKKYLLGGRTEITFLANNLDNVLIIESDGKTIVDINDALPSASQGIIRYFIDEITRRWSKVDYLFSSYGGASYYPNAVKCAWKQDMEVGKAREQFFLDNFCKIAEGIHATFSIPFASDFVLLNDNQRWINSVKFTRKEVISYFNSFYKHNTQIIEWYPDDYFENEQFVRQSGYHEIFKTTSPANQAEVEYRNEIIKKQKTNLAKKEDVLKTLELLKAHLINKSRHISKEEREHLIFSVEIVDAGAPTMLNVDLRNGVSKLEIGSSKNSENKVHVKIKNHILLHSITEEWGGDAIIIGYGCEVEVFDKEAILLQLDNLVIQLLTRYPNTKEYIRKDPFRTLTYLSRDKIKRRLLLNKIRGKKEKDFAFTDTKLSDSELWLTRTNCEICRKCNLPVLTEENTSTL